MPTYVIVIIIYYTNICLQILCSGKVFTVIFRVINNLKVESCYLSTFYVGLDAIFMKILEPVIKKLNLLIYKRIICSLLLYKIWYSKWW